jgi:hypothetical protein
MGASAGVDVLQRHKSTVLLSIHPALSCPARGLDTTGTGLPAINTLGTGHLNY